MYALYKKFISDESGAVTVDWVVLAAAIVGLSIAVMAAITDGAEDISTDVKDTLSSQLISTTF